MEDPEKRKQDWQKIKHHPRLLRVRRKRQTLSRSRQPLENSVKTGRDFRLPDLHEQPLLDVRLRRVKLRVHPRPHPNQQKHDHRRKKNLLNNQWTKQFAASKKTKQEGNQKKRKRPRKRDGPRLPWRRGGESWAASSCGAWPWAADGIRPSWRCRRRRRRKAAGGEERRRGGLGMVGRRKGGEKRKIKIKTPTLLVDRSRPAFLL